MKNGDKAGQLSKAAVALLVIAALLTAMAFLPVLQTAAAQSSGSASATGEIQTVYSASYPHVQADANSSFTVQSEYHIYKPGDTVKIQGSMSSDMKEQTQSNNVSINIKSANGQGGATENGKEDSSGNYSASITLPAGAQKGEYSADSKIEVSATVLGLLSADVKAKLESTTKFVVGTSTSYDVKASGGEQFKVAITSNSNVSEVKLNEDAKRLSFTVEGQTGTTGAAEVKIPKQMLSGEMTVLIDGQLVTKESNNVILKSQTQTDATFEINYHHSEHTVEVTGTTVAPEFPLAALMMAAGVSSVVGILAVGRATGRFGLWS